MSGHLNILLITANYAPEIGSSAQIYQDLADGFVKNGHTVHIITSYPRDYLRSDVENPEKIATDRIENGVHVHRVKHPSNRDSLIQRGLEHFYLPIYYYKKYTEICKSEKIRFDACIHHIPPLPLYYLARLIRYHDKTPSILNMQDYHPQELTDVGFIKNPLMIAVLKHIEKKAYKNADFLAVNAPGGIEYVSAKGANNERVENVFNPVSLDVIKSSGSIGDFKVREGIGDKFLVTYAGILSPFQGIDGILDVAKKLCDRQDIIFYIVGDGMEQNRLCKRVDDEKIINVQIRDYLPRNEYINLIQSTDLAIISLDERMKAPFLPGKTINLMAMAKPVIAIVANDSETARVVFASKCGVVAEPKDVDNIARTVIELKENPVLCSSYGKAGNEYLLKHMEQHVVVSQYEEIIRKIKSERRG